MEKASKSPTVENAADGDVMTGDIQRTQTWSAVGEESRRVYEALAFTMHDVDLARETATNTSFENAVGQLTEWIDEHEHDMLVPQAIISTVRDLLQRSTTTKEGSEVKFDVRMVAAVFDTNSTYQEVRAFVDPTDDPNIPCETIRAWFVGLVWACGLAAINQFFAPRQPTITVAVYLSQMFGFGMGRTAAITLPKKVFLAGTRFAFTLNPGPWSLKEQTLVTVMANVSYLTPLIGNLFFLQRLPVYLGQEWAGSFGYEICMMLSTQIIGFGLAGMCRRFLVYPPNLVWFFALSQFSLNKAFVGSVNEPANGWKMTRFQWFFTIFGAAFAYYWLPGVIFPTMTFFNWITWIKPENAVVAIVTGTYYFNMGFNPLGTLDYNWLATLDPFVTPWFVIVQIMGALTFWGVCVLIPVFFTNTFYTGYLPINSWFPYDNTGGVYHTGSILDENFRFDEVKYKSYSPIFLSASIVLRYAGMLALLPALFVFTWLWHGDTLAPMFRAMVKRTTIQASQNDIHSRLMRHYKEVPEWVFLLVTLVAMGFGYAAIYVWPVHVAGWLFPLAFACAAVFVIPIGLIVAVSGYLTDLEILFNIIGGSVSGGSPIGTFIFKVLGKSVTSQAAYFIQDMKLGHYAKIPPWTMMRVQLGATIASSFTSVGIINYQITGIDGICDMSKQQRWICSSASSAWTSAIIWGGLGPKRLFAHTSMYNKLPLALLGGALWPVLWYIPRKRWPNSVFRYCHPLVMMVAPILWAPLNFSNFIGAVPIAFIAGYWIKTRYPAWWAKYNYITSTALICGIALSTIIQFVAIFNNNVAFPDWWGTTRYLSTCDMQDCRWKTVPEGETFGPTTW